MIITILGPTACGKTQLAVQTAAQMGGEIISADSRQVYKGMDIGTGKDLNEYRVNKKDIPYHLIDICEAGDEYHVFAFQKDFRKAYQDITSRNKRPILCGGTGLYLESVIKGYRLEEAPINPVLREQMSLMSTTELQQWLALLKPLHNTTDSLDRERLLRAIEIETARKTTTPAPSDCHIPCIVFGIQMERETIRQRITERLKKRFDDGMIAEVENLIQKGVHPDKLLFYGLEYKCITLYLQKEISYNEMFSMLNIAIHQFSKRQMTWFRKMERSGVCIHWIDGNLPMEEKIQFISNTYYKTL